MPFSLTLLSGPSREVLTATDVRDALRIDGTDQDAYIESILIPMARTATELYLRRALLPQKWRLTLDRFPGSWPYTYGYGMVQSPKREIHLPIVPVISVEQILYPDPTTLAPTPLTDYQIVYSDNYWTRLQPKYGTAWPIAAWTIGDIHIDFTAGHMDEQTSPVIGSVALPPTIRAAMLFIIGHFYENRESQEIPKAAENLLQPYRVWDVTPVADNFGRFAR